MCTKTCALCLYFFKITFNIILPCMSSSLICSCALIFQSNICMYFYFTHSPFFWNSKIHHCVHKNQKLDFILNPVCTFTPYLSVVHFNILLSTHTSLKWVLPFRFFYSFICISHSPCVCYMPNPSHILDLITPRISDEENKYEVRFII